MKLQRSRAFVSAEIHLIIGDLIIRAVASTEPRFCERGNLFHAIHSACSGAASTEPRFCERGNVRDGE